MILPQESRPPELKQLVGNEIDPINEGTISFIHQRQKQNQES
jgi:hypothetical protein